MELPVQTQPTDNTMRLTVISGQNRLVRDLTPQHLQKVAGVLSKNRDILSAARSLTVLVTGTDNVTHIICRR